MPRASWRLLGLLLALSLWIAFSRFHRETTSDTLIPVFVSTDGWTAFYWEQDRYGMLVPLLTAFIRHPLANLVAQSAITIFCGLACFQLLARYFFRERDWPVIGLAATTWVLVLSAREYPAAWMSITMFYGPALALGLAAFQLVESRDGSHAPAWRWAAAFVSMALAHWVNFSICIVLVLLYGARTLAEPRGTRLRALRSPATALVIGGVVVGRAIMSTAPTSWRTDRYAFLPPGEWLGAWTSALRNRDFGVGPWALAALIPAAFGLAIWWRRRDDPNVVSLRAPLLGLAAAFLYGLVVEATDLAKLGNFPARYLVMSTAIIAVLGVGIGVSSIESIAGERVRQTAFPTMALAAMVVIGVRFGLPSWSGVEASLPEEFSKRTADLLRARCTHMIGNYWEVWPSVFQGRLERLRNGDGRPLWGITLRSSVTQPVWRTMPRAEVTLCSGKTYPEYVEGFARDKRLAQPRVVEELPTIHVLTWEPE